MHTAWGFPITRALYRGTRLTQTLALRIGGFLERQGLLERDAENSYLAGDELEAGPMEQLLGSSITYRIAVGPQQGRKVFTLQRRCRRVRSRSMTGSARWPGSRCTPARADQRQKLERLCRYISRPAIAEKRLSLTPNGNIRYQLKTPYRDGTTHVIFEPLDFIARMAALVPKPRVNLTRFHGVFAPNSKHRARVTPAKRGRGGQHARSADPEEPTPAERRAAMTWAQRLKRVFGIDIETCRACGGAVRIIACIEDPDVIEKILTHLDVKGGEPEATRRPPCRAPPQRGLFDERGGNPTMTSFGLCRQRRGNGVGCPENRREREKCAGEAVVGRIQGARRPSAR